MNASISIDSKFNYCIFIVISNDLPFGGPTPHFAYIEITDRGVKNYYPIIRLSAYKLIHSKMLNTIKKLKI